MSNRSRRIALEVLTEVETRGRFVHEALSRHADQTRNLESRDRNLLYELVQGTLRWRGRIDYILAHLSQRPLASVPVNIKNTLRLGAYQVLFLDRVPDWAAVDESSGLARRYGHEGHVRFVNGILRTLIREKDRIPFPDPARTIPYLAVTHSFPEWLVERWVSRFGKGAAEELLAACNRPPGLGLRVNTLRISRESFIEKLQGRVEQAVPHSLVPEGVEVTGAGDVTDLPGYDQGWFYVQDPGSMIVSLILDARPGEKILDACAAPGGKASHLAQLMGDQGEVAALEMDTSKVRKIRENMDRLAIRSVQIIQADATTAEFSRDFDRILVDAPCSGLGTIRRHPEAKWQKQEKDLAEHPARQLSILRNVSRVVKPGGVLLYATCSTEPEENEAVIRSFLDQAPEFRIDKEPSHLAKPLQEMFDEKGFFHAYPHLHNTDGFFAARLIKD